MELRGDKLKSYRKERGMSQAELANGICTQATVSMMENRNKLPGMEILYEICVRLGIQVSDLVGEDSRNLADIFDRVNQFLLIHDFDNAAGELNEVRIKQIRTAFDKQRYYYFLGVIQLHINEDLNEAMFNLQLSLQEFSGDEPNIYQVMTTVEMGNVYLAQKNDKLAAQMALNASRLLKKIPTMTAVRPTIQANSEIAKLAFKSGEMILAIQSANIGVELCRQNDLLFLLDELFFRLAKANHALGEVTTAKKQINIAAAISEILENEVSMKQIEFERLKLGK